jgi:hypothetical protein
MTKSKYDATNEKWLDIHNSDIKSDSMAAVVQRYAKPAQASEVDSPRFSLAEWFIIGPMMVGLGFLMGIMLP